jgi:hypothetical protein
MAGYLPDAQHRALAAQANGGNYGEGLAATDM